MEVTAATTLRDSKYVNGDAFIRGCEPLFAYETTPNSLRNAAISFMFTLAKSTWTATQA